MYQKSCDKLCNFTSGICPSHFPFPFVTNYVSRWLVARFINSSLLPQHDTKVDISITQITFDLLILYEPPPVKHALFWLVSSCTKRQRVHLIGWCITHNIGCDWCLKTETSYLTIKLQSRIYYSGEQVPKSNFSLYI